MSIANCGHDENNKYSGGKAGDQTGEEYAVIKWYSRPWNVVLRYPDEEIAQDIARIAKAAAKNDKVGYDQGTSDRPTYYSQLKAANWKVKNIAKKCETDCSASTSVAVIAAGYRNGVKALQKVSPSNTTKTLRAALTAVGFKELTKSKYLKSPNYLLPGDILLYEGHHAAINLTKGKKA